MRECLFCFTCVCQSLIMLFGNPYQIVIFQLDELHITMYCKVALARMQVEQLIVTCMWH